jgi:hypothetical protein
VTLQVVAGTRVTSIVDPFRDEADVAVDPASVAVVWVSPDGTEYVHTYGVGVDVVRDGVGRYHMRKVLDLAGRWYAEWVATGLVVDNHYVVVRPRVS